MSLLGRRAALVLGSTCLLVLAIVAPFVIPRLVIPAATADEVREMAGTTSEFDARLDVERVRNDVRVAVVQVLGGTVIILGGIATAMNVRMSQQRHDLDRTVSVSNRFSSGVDQVGSDGGPAVIGGIYTLRAVARESETHLDAVADVLSAIVRDRSARPDEDGMTPAGVSWLRHRSIDAQVALSVMGELQKGGESLRFRLYDLDLRRADLRGLDFRWCHMAGADLSGSLLDDCNFDGARMQNVRMGGVLARGTSFRHVDLRGSVIADAFLAGADMTGADVSGTNFRGCDLTDAIIQDVVTSTKTLWPANMEGRMGDEHTR